VIEHTILERVSAWAAGECDAEAAAASCVDDFLACLVLGRRAAQVQRPLRRWLGASRDAWLVEAGALAHALEWDDSIVRSVVHPAVVVVAPAISAARDVGTLVRAVGAGYDVIGYLGEVLGEAHYARWLHPTPCLGPYGGAAAAALGLGQLELLPRAFGLIPSFASGSMSFLQNGSWTKGIQTGWANRLAVEVLRLAEDTFPYPTRPFSGHAALGASFGVSEWLQPLWVSGDAYVRHVTVKPFPSCRLTHGVIEAALALALPSEAVESVEIALHPRAHAIVGGPDDTKRSAATLVERQFSAHYCAAVALAAPGRIAAALLGGELDSPVARTVDSILKSTSAIVDATLPLDGCRLTVRAGSRDHVSTVEIPQGDPVRPLDEEARRRKWRTAVGDDAEGDCIAANVSRLLKTPGASVAELMEIVDPNFPKKRADGR